MQLDKVRNWNVNVKILVAFISIGLLPSIFMGVSQLFFSPNELGEEVELLNDKAKVLAEQVTKNGTLDYIELSKGVRTIIPEVSQSLLDSYFYLNVLGSAVSFILIGIMLAHFLLPNGLKSLGYQNKTPMLFFGAFVMALNVPVLGADAMRLNDFLGLSALQEFFFDSNLLTDTVAAIKQFSFMFPNENRGYIICWIGIALIPAVGEELIFRGLLQRFFNEKLDNVHNGIALSAFIFAVFHLNFTNFFYYFILGVVLGYVYYWGRSIVFPILIHLLNNSSVLLSYFSIGEAGNKELGSSVQNGNPFDIMAYISIALILVIYYFNFQRFREEENSV
jgi:membrane protease YdiL (CAAX protease family)